MRRGGGGGGGGGGGSPMYLPSCDVLELWLFAKGLDTQTGLSCHHPYKQRNLEIINRLESIRIWRKPR